jgi:hypothetical protein
MTRVHVFCEGQTEDVFIREVLAPHFHRLDIWMNSIIVRTGPRGRGGVTSYGKIRWQINQKCREDASAWVTTMLDFYGLPKDFPGLTSKGSSLERAEAVVTAFQQDIGHRNFVANLVVHEFEGLLFSAPDAFGAWFDAGDVVQKVAAVRGAFKTPEHIDDGPTSAPSKRILKICANYDKVAHGSLIALDIGLDAIRRECPLFDAWVKRLEAIQAGGNA